MAQKIVTIVTDDLTGEESEEAGTVPFSVDGISYEIDLTPDSKDKFLEALAPFMKAARRAGRVKPAGTAPRSSARRGLNTKEVREWAKKQGYEISERGRVPATIQQAYNETH